MRYRAIHFWQHRSPRGGTAQVPCGRTHAQKLQQYKAAYQTECIRATAFQFTQNGQILVISVHMPRNFGMHQSHSLPIYSKRPDTGNKCTHAQKLQNPQSHGLSVHSKRSDTGKEVPRTVSAPSRYRSQTEKVKGHSLLKTSAWFKRKSSARIM
jgi:hypothetical protein